MIKYQKIQGVSLSDDTGLAKIPVSDEGRAMGSVPGWQVLFDPSYAENGRIRNRAQPSDNHPADSGPITIGDMSGQAIFDQELDGVIARHSLGAVNPNAWSVFWCGKFDAVSNVPRIVAPQVDDFNEETDFVLNVGFTDNGSEIFVNQNSQFNNNPVRLGYAPPSIFSDRTEFSLLMATFSTTGGLKIYDGGELVASDPTDTTPLNGALDPGAFRWWRFMRGQWGMSGLLNIDLGATENTGHRRAIEKFLMAKYGIPQGA